jgi:Fe-S oxidoreductase
VNLKFGPEYRTNSPETAFDFSDFQGLSRAAEQCAGVGACRKTITGNMCPSYMATLDEADSTRGRANALRLAISGQLGMKGLTDPALYPVMDLCLECKACKTECPTGVDMARLKSEFLHQYQKEHGTPLRSRILASAERAAVWGSRLAPVSNWILGNPLAGWIGEKFLGIESRRALPRAVRQTFEKWWKAEGSGRQAAGNEADAAEGSPSSRPRVAIFADTFTNHYEPHQGIAAVRFAEKLGTRVELPPRVCCGRPLISKGFLDRAREQAAATARTLFPLAEAGVPIVFCEPGCYSAVQDDHPLLLTGELREMAQEVSRACLTFEEWAESAMAAASESVQATVSAGPERILLHGHCHQKALVGLDPTLKLLSRIPGCEVVDADAACCGMAGSFGYEKEHYEISRAVGERKLLPAVRSEGPDTLVVAPGFSCRQQLRHFTEVEPLSTMELMERLTRS